MNRRKKFFANKMHRDIYLLVSLASLIPMFLSCAALFYLIFNVTAEQVGIPEAIAANLYPAASKVIIVICVVTPVIVAGLLVFAHKITHRIVGPYDRVVRELDDCLSGRRSGPIIVRQKDKFKPLVDRINSLLERIKKVSQ